MYALQPVVYMGIHVVLVWIATLTAKFWWESKTAHTVFLILCASMSAWNGKPHTVYSKRACMPETCAQGHLA